MHCRAIDLALYSSIPQLIKKSLTLSGLANSSSIVLTPPAPHGAFLRRSWRGKYFSNCYAKLQKMI
jgi:hypothetical protein